MTNKHAGKEENHSRVYEKLRRELGPVVNAGLEDDSIIEIILNPDGRIWFDRIGTGMVDTGETMSPRVALALLGTMAAALDTTINKEKPILEGELAFDGSRIEGIIPPVSEAPTFVIRKRISKKVDIDGYVAEGRMSPGEAEIVRDAIRKKKNVLIAGSTGSGKTTFANAVLKEMGRLLDEVRFLILEDTVELQCEHGNKTQLRTTPHVNMNDLLRATLRLDGSHIVVGEVRGGEALQLLKLWNTGHSGLSTCHSDSGFSTLLRMEQMVSEVTATPQREAIARAVNLVVYLQRMPYVGPMITEIIRVDGVKGGEYQITHMTQEALEEKHQRMLKLIREKTE